MPDYTNTTFYYAKFSNISQMSLKNMPYCDDSFSDHLCQCNETLSSLNLNTLRTGAQKHLYLQHGETYQKKICCPLQRSHTSCTNTKLCACHCHPELIVICGKPDTKKPNWQDLKCETQVPNQVKSDRPVENDITEEPTDGSSSSKSSSSCGRWDIWHRWRKHSRKNSKGPNSGNISAGMQKGQNGGNKAQKKGVKLLEPQGNNLSCNSNCSVHYCRPCEDESHGQPRKPLHSECLHAHLSAATGANKRHGEKPAAPVSKLPHGKVSCRVVPHRSSAQNSELSARTEVGDNANYQIDAGKYDHTARLEIFKLRSRIKRYTEGSDNPILSKYHTARARSPNSTAAKIKIQTMPDNKSEYQNLPCHKSPIQCTKHPPQKSVLQMSHTAPMKKKRSTTLSDVSSTVSDGRSRESYSNASNRIEPYVRIRAVHCPTHLSTKRNIHEKESASAKSVPQRTLAKSQMDASEHCTRHYEGDCQLEPKNLKPNQSHRPVPGQRPLYNYEQLPYQASEVYPDLIRELEERLSAKNSRNGSGKSTSPLSKWWLKNSF